MVDPSKKQPDWPSRANWPGRSVLNMIDKSLDFSVLIPPNAQIGTIQK